MDAVDIDGAFCGVEPPEGDVTVSNEAYIVAEYVFATLCLS